MKFMVLLAITFVVGNLKAGKVEPDEVDSTRLPYLYSWARTDKAICLFLNNGIVQVMSSL